MLVLSVDIGIRNFAFTVFCTIESRFLTFRLLDLGKVKDYVARMRELSSTEPFLAADVVLVESDGVHKFCTGVCSMYKYLYLSHVLA